MQQTLTFMCQQQNITFNYQANTLQLVYARKLQSFQKSSNFFFKPFHLEADMQTIPNK